MFLLQALLFIAFTRESLPFCGDSVRWSQKFQEEYIFGMWFTVGYVQHTINPTGRGENGCYTLFISDVTGKLTGDDADTYGFANGRNYRQRYNMNLMMLLDRRLEIIRDENGWTEIQTYTYSKEAPALWNLDRWKPGEREMIIRGTDVNHLEDPPKRAQHIRVLNSTPDVLVLYHCSDSRAYTLVLRRKPVKLNKWEWKGITELLDSYELYRIIDKTEGCAFATHWISSPITIAVSVLMTKCL